MKILLVVHEFPSREHPYITDWVNALQQSGVEMRVLCERLPARSASGAVAGPEVWVFNQLNATAFTQWSNIARMLGVLLAPTKIWHAWRMLNSVRGKKRTALRKFYEYFPWLTEKVDLVHFNGPQIAVRRFELGKLFDAPTLVSFRGQDMTFHPERYDAVLAQADHLHFISSHLVNEARKRGYAGNKHTVIPPSIDTSFYTPATPAEKKELGNVIFTAARFEWVKGLEYAIHAISILVQRGWDIQYLIAGDGSMRTAIEFAARQLGVAERVHLLGWQSEAEICQCMQKADLYLLTSVTEGFNNSVIQAQACGLPVVCSDAGGLPENIQDGVTGLLAKCRDPWDTADKIEILLKNIALRQQMGKNARQRAVESFNLAQTVEAYIHMYHSLVSD